MTWNQLKTLIESLSPEQQQTDVTVYVVAQKECWMISTMEKVPMEEDVSIDDDNDPLGGVLDDGHPFLVTTKEIMI